MNGDEMENKKDNEHKHEMVLIPSHTSESVWACTRSGCTYIKSEPEDSNSGGG